MAFIREFSLGETAPNIIFLDHSHFYFPCLFFFLQANLDFNQNQWLVLYSHTCAKSYTSSQVCGDIFDFQYLIFSNNG